MSGQGDDVELVYADFTGDDGVTRSVPHRVVSKTAIRIYVNHERYRAERWREEAGAYGVRTSALDRAALERDGEVWCEARCETFYTRPYEARSKGDADGQQARGARAQALDVGTVGGKTSI